MGPDGMLFLADYGPQLNTGIGSIIYRVKMDGSSTVFATGADGASGNSVDGNGNLIQSNIRGGFVWRVSPDGKVETIATNIISPTGTGTDSFGNIFIGSCRGFVHKVDSAGDVTVFYDGPLLKCPNGLTLDDNDNVYIANFSDGNVLVITPEGEASVLATMPGGNNAHLTFANGRLYVVDRGNHQIYDVSLSGEISLLAGSGVRGKADGQAMDAEFSIPNGIAASVTGDSLFVNDAVPVEGDPMGVINPVVIRLISGVHSTLN